MSSSNEYCKTKPSSGGGRAVTRPLHQHHKTHKGFTKEHKKHKGWDHHRQHKDSLAYSPQSRPEGTAKRSSPTKPAYSPLSINQLGHNVSIPKGKESDGDKKSHETIEPIAPQTTLTGTNENAEVSSFRGVDSASEMHQPGAFHVGDLQPTAPSDDFTITAPSSTPPRSHQTSMIPVTARMVDEPDEDVERLQAELQEREHQLHQRDSQLQMVLQERENAAIAQVIVEEPLAAQKSCCVCFPYGWLTAAPIILGFLGTILSWASLANCSFFMATTNFSVAGIGYIKYIDPYLYTCQVWEEEDQDAFFDGTWKFGMTMGFLAGTFGLINLVLNFILCCTALSRLAVQLMAASYLVLGIFSILMLVGLASDVCSAVCRWLPQCTQCSLSMAPGARMCIAAFLLFTGASIATFFLKEREVLVPVASSTDKDETEARDEENQTPPESALPRRNIGTSIDVVEKLNDDGTKTVTTTRTNPDGTKTIHTSIEAA